MVFARQHNPESLAENTITHFIEMEVTENVWSKQQVFNEENAPGQKCVFKYQKSANLAERHHLGDLTDWCHCPASLHKSDDLRTIQIKGT